MSASTIQRGVRTGVPYVFLPLCLIGSVLSAAPWLRSFPVSRAAAPFYGAAVLSVLVPLVVVRIRPRWLWLSALLDLVVFVVYTLIVVLQEPIGFGDLAHGIVHGPSEILTFALPLVTPRNLMVAPAALIWLAGALAGECAARRWHTMLPYLGFLVSFGLAYAGTQRAAGSDVGAGQRQQIMIAGGLLATLLLMRAAQAWVRQDQTAESTQPDGVLPLRSLFVGMITALLVAPIVSVAVQTAPFPVRAHEPQRMPTVDQSRPLTPLAFVAGLRTGAAGSPVRPVFTVDTDRPSPGYFTLANVDFYDGSGWSFDRTFRPSGGVLPDDTDAALRTGTVLTQRYRMDNGPLSQAPWMPFVYRAHRVTGAAVNIDAASGMIVPASRLGPGVAYTVVSDTTEKTFDHIKTRTASPDTATPTLDTQLPGSVRTALDEVVRAFSQETGTPMTPALPFLQALQRDLRSKYSLSGAAQGSTGSPTSAHSSHRPRDAAVRALPHSSKSASKRASTSSAHASAKPTAKASPTPTSSPSPTTAATPPPSPSSGVAGSTGFADVLASILGPNRSGTPEQFATLLALVARDLGVPARVVTGFRVEPPDGATQLPAGHYEVTMADAWTWTEVPINGVGWVVLDGSPARFADQTKQTASGAPPPPPSSSAPPSQNALVTGGSSGNAVAKKSSVPHSSSAPAHALLLAIVVAVGVLLLVAAVILLLRKRIRAARRRRVPDPRLRLIGAWHESLDVFAEAGLPELRALTSAEIATIASEQFGAETGDQTAALGAAANAVAYSPSTPIADADAAAAWTRYRILRKQVHRQLGVRGRLAAGLRYHRRPRATPAAGPASWAETAAPTTQRRPRGRSRHRHRAH